MGSVCVMFLGNKLYFATIVPFLNQHYNNNIIVAQGRHYGVVILVLVYKNVSKLNPEMD